MSKKEIDDILRIIPAKPSLLNIFGKNYTKDLKTILMQLDKKNQAELLKYLKSRKNIKIFVDDFGKHPELISIINKFPEKGIEVYALLANHGFGSNVTLLEWLNNFERYVVRDRMSDVELYKTLVISKLKDGRLILKSEKYPETEIIYDGYKMIAKAGGKGLKGEGGPVNQFLNSKRMPNMEYEVDGVIFKTDKYGRTAKVSGEVNQTHINNKPHRNNKDQTSSVKRMGGNLNTDQGGHAWGNQFGGPNEDINLTPMLRSVNNGEYKSLENTIT